MHMLTPAREWTADDVELLPDDGNRYEVVDGELFVTPAPSLRHQAVLDAFHARLRDFARKTRIGFAFFAPGDVPVDRRNLVQPDLFVLPPTNGKRPDDWKSARLPILVVEILSATTSRRDLGAKRDLYRRAGVAEYWIVDHAERSVQIVRPGAADVLARDRVEWRPAGADRALVLDLPELFAEALDD